MGETGRGRVVGRHERQRRKPIGGQDFGRAEIARHPGRRDQMRARRGLQRLEERRAANGPCRSNARPRSRARRRRRAAPPLSRAKSSTRSPGPPAARRAPRIRARPPSSAPARPIGIGRSVDDLDDEQLRLARRRRTRDVVLAWRIQREGARLPGSVQRDQADRIEKRRGLEQALAGLQFGEGGRACQNARAIGLGGGGDRGGVERGRRQRHIEPGAQGADDRGQSARLRRAQQQQLGPLQELGFLEARGVMIGQRIQGAASQHGGGVARAAADASEYCVRARARPPARISSLRAPAGS